MNGTIRDSTSAGFSSAEAWVLTDGLLRRLNAGELLGPTMSWRAYGFWNEVGTNAALVDVIAIPVVEPATSGGLPIAQPESLASPVSEVRRRSGLTWDQLSRLFGVTRRALHFWASGKAMTATHEEHLQRVLAVIRRLDRGSSSATRTLLLSTRRGGVTLLDLLARRGYDEVAALAEQAAVSPVAGGRLSPEARSARTPRPPEELVGALHDSPHREVGRARGIKRPRRATG